MLLHADAFVYTHIMTSYLVISHEIEVEFLLLSISE